MDEGEWRIENLKSEMKISIIILNYNVKYFTDACLQSVLKAVTDDNVEIIVADNNSTDGSRQYFEGRYPGVKFLWFEQNHGFGKAYNKAVAQAQGEYLLFLNPDTLVSEDILKQFKEFARNHPGLGIAGGKMIDGTGNFLPESKRGIPTPVVALSKLTKLYKLLNFKPFNTYYASYLNENETGEVPVLTGALMFMKKSVFESAGGFDEQFFMYGEDIDLSYRILKAGYKNYYLPKAKIIHFKGESSRRDAGYYRNFLKTTFQFYRKHFRSFPPLEFMMRQYFKLWLKLRLKKSEISKKNIDIQQVYLIGTIKNDKNLKKHYPGLQHIKTPDEISIKPALLIFDTGVLSFSQIINFMEDYKNQNIYFRFYFPSVKLLTGSDYKDALGDVVLI